MDKAQIEAKREKEKETVGLMIHLYCNGNHGTRRGELCTECAELLDYASARADRCPYMETKTFCSRCKTHCYRPDMREKIRLVMRWSGPRMLLYHPQAAVRHAIETIKAKKASR